MNSEPVSGAGAVRGVLVTGVTGFLGKVVLDDLLRREPETGPVPLFVTVRACDLLTARERFRREVAESPALRSHDPAWQDRVTVLCADLAAPGAGIAAPERASLRASVSHVIHCAASVEFTLPLAEAADANIHAALHVQALAEEIGAASLVSVSTAYATPHRAGPGRVQEVAEELAPLPRDPEAIFDELTAGRATEAALLAETGHPNTYTLTKCLAEHLLAGRARRVPVTLLRPSIISASRHLPEPGWIDSTAAFAAFVLLMGSGNLRAIYADLSAFVDLVPCDEVARRIVDDALAPPAADGPVRVRHATAGLARSPGVGAASAAICAHYERFPVMGGPRVRYVGSSQPAFRWHDLRTQRAVTALGGLWFGLVRNHRGRRAARRLAERQATINRVFPYFTTSTFDFRSSVPLDDDYEPLAYVELVCDGVHRNLMRQDPRRVPIAGRRFDGRRLALPWAWRTGRKRGPSTPRGQRWLVRACAAALAALFDRCAGRIHFDRPSFEVALAARRDDELPIVLPSHRSYLDFLLVPFLFYSHPELGLAVPRIAADRQFARIPVLGRVARAAGAFFLDRGKGREDKALTRAVHQLVADRQNVLVFVEGARSRTRAPLPPHRGLLRSLQSTGTRFLALPVTIDYDRVAEEGTFEGELAGAPASGIQLGQLFRWLRQVWKGEIDIGEVHVSCGAPLHLDLTAEVGEFADDVMEELRGASVVSELHLRVFLAAHPDLGLDVATLRRWIEERGGRVIESELEQGEPVGPQTELALRSQWLHHFFGDALAHFAHHEDGAAIRHYVDRHAHGRQLVARPVEDAALARLLDRAFGPIASTYRRVAELSRHGPGGAAALDVESVMAECPGLHRPYVLPALEVAYDA